MPKWLESPIVNKVIRKTVTLLNPKYHRIILIILGVILVLQWLSLGYTFYDFQKIDKKVSIMNEEKEEPEENSNNQPPPPRNLQPKDNIFKRTTIPYVLTAILNDKAIIDGQTVAAGDRIQKATVESINIDSVVLEMEGESTRTLKIFSEANMQAMPERNTSSGLGQEQGMQRRGRSNNRHERKSMMPAPKNGGVKQAPAPQPSSSNQDLPPDFDKIPDKYKAKALEQWGKMSEEEKNRIRQHSQ